MPPVDLVDDVQMTRQQVFEEVNWPALKGLRQDGVIGVCTGTNHNLPGLDVGGKDQREEGRREQTNIILIWTVCDCDA